MSLGITGGRGDFGALTRSNVSLNSATHAQVEPVLTAASPLHLVHFWCAA